MKLKAKIYPKYLDDILSGEKLLEHRQIESITLTDGKREIEIDVPRMYVVNEDSTIDHIMSQHPDVKWNDTKPILELVLGDTIYYGEPR